MAVDYQPKFQHVDWIDNVDRVQAAGEHGFNQHFHDLEDEFTSLAEVVGLISDALDALAQAPPATPVKLTLTPMLVATGSPWQHVFGGATKPPGATDASGMMTVELPHGTTIQSFRATGQKGSGSLEVNLRRQSLAAGANPELLVGLTPPVGPFDQTAAGPAAAAAKVDNDQFRYYVTAELDSATAASTVQLTCFQITHIAS
jgi:hypothetical protein